MPDRLTLETTTGPDTLAAIQELLDEVWATHEVPEIVRIHMELAAGEIGANIVEHSGGGGPVQLRVEVRISEQAIQARFTDDGHPSRVDMSDLTMPDEWSERGRGLALAHRVLDELSYRRDADGNHWTLVRKRTE
jgi:serine/threonine-protein kinase RsbW